MQPPGLDLEVELKVDAKATVGMLHRKGLGKLMHMSVHDLWLQDAIRRKDIKLSKVPGTENPADMMTRHVGQQLIAKYMAELGFEFN